MLKQYGFTIIEIMISLFLVNVLILILVQMYVFTKKEYLKAEYFLDQHMDRVWITNLLTNSVRRSGFTPCLPLENLKVLDHRQPSKKIQSLEINSSNIIIKRMDEQFNVVKKLLTNDRLILTADFKMNSRRPIIISDCHHAEIIKRFKTVNNKSQQIVHLLDPLQYRYQPPIFVSEFIEENWQIKEKSPGQKSLYFQSEELSVNVSNWIIDWNKTKNHGLLKIKITFVEKEFLELDVRIRSL